mgnify:CR=1 FL=1
MAWIYLVLFAQFLNALVVLVDKYIITAKTSIKPITYAFFVSLLSIPVIVLVPFGLISLPTFNILSLSLFIGLSYVFSILFLYKGLTKTDASDVVPVMGSLAAITSFVFGAFLLNEKLSEDFVIAFTLLVLGTGLMSYFRFNRKVLFYSIASGVLFGLSSVFIKLIFFETYFLNGFFWSRMGNVFGALLLICWPSNLKTVMSGIRQSNSGTRWLVLGNKFLAGIAFLLIFVGIKLGDVSLVNALNGAQFVFIILFAFIFSKKFPDYFYEDVHHKETVLQKILALKFIIIGLAFLFL